jgi:hypothetical protein
MNTVAIDLVKQAGPFAWLVSPVGLVSLLAILGFVLTGIPGRIILRMETQLAWRNELRQRRLDRHDNVELLTAITSMEREA